MAVDLGTSAFKAAWVDQAQRVGPVAEARYRLDCNAGSVTCPVSRYRRALNTSLARVAESARDFGLTPEAVAITSQAQTFVPLDSRGVAQPAVVWLDSAAACEAELAARVLGDFATTSGFTTPSPLQLLPKLIQRRGSHAVRYLLLNEWAIQELTGEAIGDSCQQGMGGLWDTQGGFWNDAALELAGVHPGMLARVGPAAALSAPLSPQSQTRFGLGPIPVYSCGNDQSCAAIGAGIRLPGSLFCGFGTALVVYGLSRRFMPPASPDHIAGRAPLPGLHFLLGLESECGNVLDWLANLLMAKPDVGRLVHEALAAAPTPLRVGIHNGRIDLTSVPVGATRAQIGRAVLELYANRFAALRDEMTRPLGPAKRIVAAGGLSRSQTWLRLLSERCGIEIEPCDTPHAGLRGAAAVVRIQRGEALGAPV